MLARIWNLLSNAGITHDLDPSASRYITLTNLFGVISALISFSIFFIVFFASNISGWTETRGILLTSAFLYSIILWANHKKYYDVSRILISWLPPIFIMLISIYEKMLEPHIVGIQDYFSFRFFFVGYFHYSGPDL